MQSLLCQAVRWLRVMGHVCSSSAMFIHSTFLADLGRRFQQKYVYMSTITHEPCGALSLRPGIVKEYGWWSSLKPKSTRNICNNSNKDVEFSLSDWCWPESPGGPSQVCDFLSYIWCSLLRYHGFILSWLSTWNRKQTPSSHLPWNYFISPLL